MPHKISTLIQLLFFISFILYIFNNSKFLKISLILVTIHYIINRVLISMVSDNIGNADEYAYPYLSKILSLGTHQLVSIDVGTSGSLNSAIMYLPALLNLDINIITSRIMASLILTLTIFLLYKLLILVDRKSAPLYLIPILIFYGSGVVSYHTAYTSEFLATLIVIYSIYTYILIDEHKKIPAFNLLISAIILPLSLFCKLQVAPLALTIWMYIAASTYKISSRALTYFIFISILTLGIFIFIYYKNEALDYLFLSYFRNNTMRSNLLLRPGLWDDIKYLTSMSVLNVFYLLIFTKVLFNYKMLFNTLKNRFFIISIFLVTLLIILYPKWNFDHYLHFLIMIIPIVLAYLNSEKNNNET